MQSTLQDAELVDCAAHLDVDVPGGCSRSTDRAVLLRGWGEGRLSDSTIQADKETIQCSQSNSG